MSCGLSIQKLAAELKISGKPIDGNLSYLVAGISTKQNKKTKVFTIAKSKRSLYGPPSNDVPFMNLIEFVNSSHWLVVCVNNFQTRHINFRPISFFTKNSCGIPWTVCWWKETNFFSINPLNRCNALFTLKLKFTSYHFSLTFLCFFFKSGSPLDVDSIVPQAKIFSFNKCSNIETLVKKNLSMTTSDPGLMSILVAKLITTFPLRWIVAFLPLCQCIPQRLKHTLYSNPLYTKLYILFW